MKIKSYSWIFTAILGFSTIFLCHCKKDNDGSGIDAGNGTMTMTVDGNVWSSRDAVNGTVMAEAQGFLTVQGWAADNSQLSFSLPTPSQGTTWDFTSGGSLSYSEDVVNGPMFTFLPGSGRTATVTFTTYNNQKAKGTFSFSLVRFDNTGNEIGLEITNGNFELNF